MMKRLAFFLSLLAALWLPAADASNLYSPHRLAVVGGTRPTLLSATGSFTSTDTASRTLSVTPPVGTSLLIAYIGAMRESAHGSFDLVSVTFGGTALNQLTDFNHFGDRVIDGFAYRLSPTTGVAQDLVFTTAAAWNGIIIYVWMFSGTPADSFGQNREVENLNSSSVTATFSPEYGRPYILAGSVAAKNGGGGDCYIGTNLTIAVQGRTDDEDIFAGTAANATLVAAGSTPFTMNCASSGTGHISGEFVEIVGP